MASVHITKKDSILEQLDEIRHRIAQRAYDLFSRRGGSPGDPVGYWLAAERDILSKPTMELREENGMFTVLAALPDFEPRDVKVDVTPEDLVIRTENTRTRSKHKGQVHLSEFTGAEVFRSVPFPRSIDPAKARAELRNGLLTITAPVAEPMKVKDVMTEAA
jgi:HSP20 family molecular chaperone IbpA